jgi:hypothetical protein
MAHATTASNLIPVRLAHWRGVLWTEVRTNKEFRCLRCGGGIDKGVIAFRCHNDVKGGPTRYDRMCSDCQRENSILPDQVPKK